MAQPKKLVSLTKAKLHRPSNTGLAKLLMNCMHEDML